MLNSSWNGARDDGSATRAGFDRELALHKIRAITHDANPDPFHGVYIFREADSVVRNAQAGRAISGAEADIDPACFAVLARIVNRLLGNAVKMRRFPILTDVSLPGCFKSALDWKQSTRRNRKLI